MNKIENEKQAQVTKNWIVEFKKALVELEENGSGGNPMKHQLFKNSNKSMIQDLEKQLEEYENSKKNN